MSATGTGVLDEILARVQRLPPQRRAELEQLARKHIAEVPWVPTPGPQMDAYNSKADILLFGGSAGSSKTDLLLGLAFTAHRQSLILRRQYTDLGGITDRAIQINRTRKGFNGSPPPKLKTTDGRVIEFGAAAQVGDEASFQGRPHDMIGFDEGVQFAEQQFRFLLTWLRSTMDGQRCRAVIASNPPVTAEGEWLVRFFAPWLDPTHPNPAQPGELRWFVTDENDQDLEVSGPEMQLVGGKLVKPMSRTFIPGKLADNPFLAKTDYAAKLDALPEPYRSAFRDGNFMLARKDALNQVIPTQWVREAQARWTPHPPQGIPMCAIGADIAQGGEDQTVLAPRHDSWFAKLIAVSGRETPTGPSAAGFIIAHRRDKATVVIDMGGGFGGSAYDHLMGQQLESATPGMDAVIAYKGAEGSSARTIDNQLTFFNKRSETYWKFREALDPGQAGGSNIALPPDPEMVSDLTAPTFTIGPRGIQVEPKEDVVKKLGRSPDKGDAVVMSWSHGATISTHHSLWNSGQLGGRTTQRAVIRSHDAQRKFLRRGA